MNLTLVSGFLGPFSSLVSIIIFDESGSLDRSSVFFIINFTYIPE